MKTKIAKNIICAVGLLAASFSTAADYTTEHVMKYKTPGKGKPLSLHLYQPSEPASDPLPCIVFFFGGGWMGGNPRQFFQQADYFRRRGIVAVSAEYRTKGSHGVTPQECVADAKSAIRWVRKNAGKLGIDPDRIIAAGGSAGGHVAVCTGVIEGFEDPNDDQTVSSRPNAMVLFNPVLDTTEKGFGANKVGDNKTEISPCHQVKPGIPPTLLFHGDRDTVVPHENAERFTRLMTEAGNTCKLVTFEGKGHGFFNGSFFRSNNKDDDYVRTMNEADQWLTELGLIDGTPLPLDQAVRPPAAREAASPAPAPGAKAAGERPNMIFILTDDLGYGDLSHMGGKAPTPHCDRLAREGIRFTDAHTSSAVCTPTRYGILAGRYNWRSRLKKGVLGGYSGPLIPPERNTIAHFLKQQGYHTGMVGKWHLGIGWKKLPNGEFRTPLKSFIDPAHKGKRRKGGWDIDYSKPAVTPVHNGFDYFFGIAASLDMPPYVYIKNDRAISVPTVEKAFDKPHRPGPATEDFEAGQCLIEFARESRTYIAGRAKDPSKPFFLYLPLTSPHTPIVPTERWIGKSGLGKYGDFLMETDWVVGEVLAELDRQGLADNTLVVFTSDNGCSPMADIPGLIRQGHKPNGDWRGHKADIFEGGHRVPFLVRWPVRVKAGQVSDSTICTVDFFATAAEALGVTASIGDDMAEDSYSFFADLTATGKTERPTTIHHSINGSFAIREGKWKLNLCPGSGGWSPPRPGKDTEGLPLVQLYDLEADPAESTNLEAEHPEIVERLVNQLAREINAGRSTPGKAQTNEGKIPFPGKLVARYPALK